MSQQPPVCDYEGSDYQQTFWDTGKRAYEDRVEEIAIRRLLPAGGRRLLELGAGAGRNTPRYRGFEKVVLLDYARSQLKLAQQRLGSDRYIYVAADVYRLPFAPGVFDCATMIRTLHHMADPQAALTEVRSVLQGGGSFLLEYANKRNLKAVLRWMLRRQEWNPFDRDPIEYIPLNYDFHPAAVRSWLAEAGFQVMRQLTVSHFRVGFLKRTIPLELLVGLDSLLQWTGSLVQLSPSVFVQNRAAGDTPAADEGVFWRCPACGSLELEPGDEVLLCAACGRRWPVRDGIYDFKDHL
ncbi:MAG: methyltransferase domain-containing protein [Anaerolineales bacterium]|nr:methyltransferase domain-containing protein [Anaerolineales bacterium]